MSVIDRSMRVLELLADAGVPVSLTELSAQTGLPLTTVHRLCGQLLKEGLVERDDEGGLLIGLRLWELGRRHARTETIRLVAARFLRDLHEVTRGAVELMMIDGDHLYVVERLSAVSRTREEWAVLSERVPLRETSAGIAILAGSADERLEAARRGAGVRGARELDSALRDARNGGVVRRTDPRSADRFSLAAAIRARGRVEAAVQLTVDGEQAARIHAPSVLVTARRIGAALDL